MYSITDAHKALSCGRSTVYSIMKEAGIETTKSGLSQLMTDEQFQRLQEIYFEKYPNCLLYTSPSPRDRTRSRMPSSA